MSPSEGEPRPSRREPQDIQAFNQQVIAEYRANAGKLSGQFANASLPLLNTMGAKSGLPRTAPLGFVRDADRYVIVAAGVDGPSHPAWYYNLLAAPTATVEVGPERFQVRCNVAAGEERERLFRLVATQQKSRPMPVVVLGRVA